MIWQLDGSYSSPQKNMKNNNSHTKTKPLASVLAFGMALVAGAFAVDAQTLKVGDPAPPLQVSRWVQGEPVTEFAPDKVYLVEFWATWCQPCIASMPHLNELASKFEEKGLVVIGQNVFERNEKLVEQFRNKMSYRIALDDKSRFDEGAMAETWMAAAGETGIPCSFLVGKDGRTLWIGHPGDLKEGMIVHALAGNFDASKWTAELQIEEAEEKKRWKNLMSKAFQLDQKFKTQLREKNWDEADTTVAEIIEIMPPESELDIVKADYRVKILMAKGDTNAAVQEVARILDKYPQENPQFFLMMATDLLNDPALKGDALGLIEEIVTRVDKNFQKIQGNGIPANLAALARISFMKGDKEQAIQLQQQAIDLQKQYTSPEIFKKFGEKAYGRNVAYQSKLQSTLESYKSGQLPEL